MRLFLLLALISPSFYLAHAQNLVPNGNFERIRGERPKEYLITPELFSKQMPNWFSPNNGTPDIVTELFDPIFFHPNLFWGKLMPRSGNACIGLIALSHIIPEAVGNQLEEKMEIEKTYEISFWVGLPAVSRGYKRDTATLDADFRMFFSQERLAWNDKHFVTPQITCWNLLILHLPLLGYRLHTKAPDLYHNT